MANPFDQFDSAVPATGSSAPAGFNPAGANPFDQFDAKPQGLPPPPDAPMSGEVFDQYFSHGTPSRILDLFGQGAAHGFGAEPLGISPENDKWLRQHAPDLGLIGRAFHDELVRPAAMAIDATLRGISGLAHGVGDIAVAAGVPSDIVALPGAFPTGLAGAGLLPAGAARIAGGAPVLGGRANIPAHGVPPLAADLEQARQLGVIGRGEAGWLGVTEMPAEEASREAIARLTPNRDAVARQVSREPFGPGTPPYVYGNEAFGPPEAQGPAAIHFQVRQANPDLFAEWDDLAQQRQTYRQWLDELRDNQQREAEAAAPQAAEIADTEKELAKASGTKARGLEILLDRLKSERDDFIEQHTAEDSPGMQRVREGLMQTDYRMRDLGLDVSAAYREAATPPAPDAAGVAGTTPPATPTAETVPAPPAAPQTPALIARPEPPPALPIAPGSTGDIAADVTRQLVRAGRPLDEASQAAALWAAHYEARAARFDGALGSAFDLYRQEGPQIRGRDAGGPGGEASGRTTVNAKTLRSTITLFQNADASTFIHETGHQWLEELLRDAADERAPQALKDDAEAVRQWAGIGGNGPTRKQHEQFARGFEAYMMEGRAPSPALAGVFGQFRGWLIDIYNRLRGVELPIIDSVRGVYDRLIGMPDKIALAPERELPLTYDAAHEAAAETVPPHQAGAAADIVAGERERAAQIAFSEAENAGRRAVSPDDAGEGAGRGALGSGQSAGLREDRGAAGGAQAVREIGTGGSDAARQGDTASNQTLRRRPETAYEAVPPEPRRLAEFLKKAGGIADEGGELRAIDAHKARPGLVNRNGLSLDMAREQAEEAGYLPPGSTVADLVAALDHDLRHGPVYSAEDADLAAKFNAATERNREVDRLAQQLGIDPRDWTKEQFWNMAAEQLRAEEQAHLQSELDAARETEFAEAERRAKAWAESRGDAWEPEVYRARTLEDMDDENQQQAAAATQPGGVERARPAGGHQGAVQGRGGQGGGDAGTGGGAGTAIGGAEPGTDANRRFGDATRLVDKAGNIRLDNLNQPDDIDRAIRDAAARNSDFLPERRGTLSDGEVLDLAEALGKDPAFLDRKKIGAAFNAEEILAARQLLIQSATAVRDAMTAASAGGDAEVLALAQAIAKHEMIQGKVAQATAEWGRAGRSFRMLIDGQAEAGALDAFLRENSGRTLYQIQQLADLGQNLQTPAQVSKLIADTTGGRLRQAVLYYYINALISGPVTHLRYSIGNAVSAFWTPLVEVPIAAGYGATRAALGIGSAADRVYLGEAGAQLWGLVKGTREGWGAAYQAFKTGVSPALPGEHVPAHVFDQTIWNPLADLGVPRPIANAINIPSRSVAGIHSFFKAIRYEQNTQALAYRQAMQEGLAGDAFASRVADLTASPTPEMMASATPEALKELYMAPTEYHSFGGALVRVSNYPNAAGFVVKVMAPFMKIGSQMTRNAFIERTPLGLASGDVRGRLFSGEASGDMQAAKITAGIGLIGATVLMTLEGNMTGDGPTDPAKRAVWLLNHRPNSIQIGSITVPYQGLGSLGMLMRFAANMTETAQRWDDEDGYKLAVSVLEGVTRSVLDENFMRGVKDALDAVYHWQEYGPRWLKGFATNWLPFSVGMGQVARVIDPYSREQHTILQAAEAKGPLLSEQLMPRRDVFGEPIASTTGLPQAAPRYANDATVQALDELHVGIGRIPRKVRGVDLTDQQYDDFTRIAGRLTKLLLDQIVPLPGFAAQPAERRIEIIHQQVEAARERARRLVMMQAFGGPNDITAQATAAKIQKLTGVKP